LLLLRTKVLRVAFFGFDFARLTTSVMLRVAGAIPGALGCAVNSTLNFLPLCDLVGLHVTIAVPGFPADDWSTAFRGRPSALIATLTTGAPGAAAASEKTSSFLTATVKRLLSAGVGAAQVAAGVAPGRAATDAGNAKQSRAAPARSFRCRPPTSETDFSRPST
jgi:hypothetical protein